MSSRFLMDESSRSLSSAPLKNEISTSSYGRDSRGMWTQDDSFRVKLESLSMVGRQSELTLLKRAYLRTSHSTSELVLLHGESGSGKDTLVKEFSSFVESRNGVNFAKGKFDQLSSSDAFAVVCDACNQLCEALLAFDDNLQETRTKLQETLGPQAHVLTERMPSFKLLLGTGASDEDHNGPTERVAREHHSEPAHVKLARLKVLYRSLFHCICSSRHPVLLFLNDLQWADPSSMQIIHALISDKNAKHLLIICAYRDDGENVEAIEQALLKGTSFDGTNISGSSSDFESHVLDIRLHPLNVEDMKAILQFVTNKTDTTDLAEVVHRKTLGNPYFTLQYLDILQTKKSLVWNTANNQWDYDLQAILCETNATDNVVKLVSERVQQLPEQVQCILRYAAYLGHRFSANVLEVVVPREIPSLALHREKIVTALSVGLRQGLLEKLQESVYKFSHDKIQESMYYMIEDNTEREELHLEVGRSLIVDKPLEDWKLFLAVDNLNRGSNRIKEITEVEDLIKLNLEAAKVAARKTLLHAAVEYLRKGIGLMDDFRWTKNYEQTLVYYSMAAEMELATGDHRRCYDIMYEVHRNARSFDDCIPLYLIEVTMVGCGGDLSAAIALGITVLKKLGVFIPTKPSMRHVVLELLSSKYAIGSKTDDDLLALPSISDERKAAAMKLLSSLTVHAYLINIEGKHILAITLLRMVRLSCKYGLSKQSPHAFCGFAMVQVILGNFGAGTRFFSLAQKMAEALDARESLSRLYCLRTSFETGWKSPPMDMLDPLLNGYHFGISTCDTEYAYLCILTYLTVSAFIGTHTDKTIEGCQLYAAEMEACNQKSMLYLMFHVWQWLVKLRGDEPDIDSMVGGIFDYDMLVHEMIDNKQLTSITALRVFEVSLMSQFGGDTEKLASAIHFVAQHRKLFDGYYYTMIIHMTLAHGCHTMFQTTGERYYKKLGRKCTRVLMNWSKKGFVTANALWLFANALMISTDKSSTRAKVQTAYQDAVTAMQRTHLKVHEAQVYAQLVPIMIKYDDQVAALGYLQRAVEAFESLGQRAAARWLRNFFSNIEIKTTDLNEQKSLKRMQSASSSTMRSCTVSSTTKFGDSSSSP